MTWYEQNGKPRLSEDAKLSSRHMKTLDAIMTRPHTNLTDQEVKGLLKAMGFKHRQNRTSHQIWTHPETGARFGFVEGKHHERFPDFKLKELKKAMIDRGIIPTYRTGKQLGAEVPDIPEVPKPSIDKQRVDILNSFANQVSEVKQELENNTMSEKEILQRVKQLEVYAITTEQTLKDIQDFLLELGAKVEKLPSLELSTTQFASLTEQIKAIGSSAPHTPALSPKYQAIRDALAANPQFKDNPQVIGAIAGTTARVVTEYLSKHPN